MLFSNCFFWLANFAWKLIFMIFFYHFDPFDILMGNSRAISDHVSEDCMEKSSKLKKLCCPKIFVRISIVPHVLLLSVILLNFWRLSELLERKKNCYFLLQFFRCNFYVACQHDASIFTAQRETSSRPKRSSKAGGATFRATTVQ